MFRLLQAYGGHRTVWLETKNQRAFGVPPGGAFDLEAAALANALVGQEGDLLEIALGPVTIEATESFTLGVVGGPDAAIPLAKGETLTIRPENAHAYLAAGTGPARRLANPPRFVDSPIRVLRAHQPELLGFADFIAQPYRVGHASNRVGIRLEGTAIPHDLSLPSGPAIPGLIQLPPSGHPIILGPDGPTIGGYPKIAIAIQADRSRLARLHPGMEVRFEEVTIQEARLAWSLAQAELALRVAELRTPF